MNKLSHRLTGLVVASLLAQGCNTSTPTAESVPIVAVTTAAPATAAPATAAPATTPATPTTSAGTADPSSGAGTAQAPGSRLVTLSDNDAGWLLVGGTSQWLSPECRGDIEASGTSFEIVEWSEIERTSDPATLRSCAEAAAVGAVPSAVPGTPIEMAALGLARGINFAGDFEVEPRRSWGEPILDADFALAADAGFDHIRLPIRWSSYTGAAPDFAIDPGFFAEVDAMVELAQLNGLNIVVNVHHFEELDLDPFGERARYLAIWEQLAIRYAGQPSSVVFELLNEPIGVFDDQPELWNELAAEALAIVRRSNPTRTVIIGPVSYNHADRLDDLELPDDPNLVATIHTYDPDSFTVQGAVFIDPIPATGVTWSAGNGSIAFGWQQQSWNVRLTPVAGAISIDWGRTFGAFAVGALDEPVAYDTVEVTASEAFDAAVLCNYEIDDGHVAEVIWNGTTGTADVSRCGSVTSLALQHVGADLARIDLRRFAACAAVCDELIATQYDSLDRLITGAAEWAEGEGVPLYLGEFGTYNPIDAPTDPDSRLAWTTAVRTISERNGAGWAYFAMNDEFGAFDRATNQWIPEVVNGLFD